MNLIVKKIKKLNSKNSDNCRECRFDEHKYIVADETLEAIF